VLARSFDGPGHFVGVLCIGYGIGIAAAPAVVPGYDPPRE
jgi:hypothetical protein